MKLFTFIDLYADMTPVLFMTEVVRNIDRFYHSSMFLKRFGECVFAWVSLWVGKTKEQKAELAKALTDTMAKVAKVPPEAVTIMFEELPKENWATKGVLHSELHADRS